MSIVYSLSNDTWGHQELSAIQRVIDSNIFSMGTNVKRYEEDFCQHFGCKYAVMSNSGSSANLLAIAALIYSGRLQHGDEVLVPAVSWSTTYFPLTQYGLKVRFVDIDGDTLNIDLNELEHAVTPNSRAVLVVNLLGNPNYFDKLTDICNKNNLILLEDNCESMGASVNGKHAGTFGLMGTFSSFYSHHICTMEGGVTVTDDEELYHYLLSIRAHGWTRNLPEESKLYTKNENPFYETFNFIMPGYNLRPLEMEAAIGIEQLKKINSFVEIRRKNAECFQKKFSQNPMYRLQKEVGNSSWFGFSIVLSGEAVGRRDYYVNEFHKCGIEVRPIVAGNFTRQKALKYMDYSLSGKLENADDIHNNGFFVGNHSVPMDDKIQHLFETMERVERCI